MADHHLEGSGAKMRKHRGHLGTKRRENTYIDLQFALKTLRALTLDCVESGMQTVHLRHAQELLKMHRMWP